ncbi:MAG: amino acid ABC transporter ATP-binding protein [Peptoniphilus sp.]|uniref:amino acid ABC transporter ATP-binding protein n=1 Tax=Peptoniphilus sp. TaxID=1971214 RepID=UPI0025E2C176|nr:amino acid ABC transporter ATP-binding protein [Peptoniphilus sp.]MCI5643120.1 amino acid ABC transporter ATP-binding protein [Peptoniphilus sp.]MDD7352247.1 amino acid ABC transporter ATP-binding protein [Peptoniphilaceae bacterium]MDY3902173.1 amino acid ABC transporter ATP-binding protein [Peptoniphilus sp.]
MIKIENLYKSFGDKEVLKGINLDIKDSTVTTIIGASGSGKSTLLRTINLLEKCDDGKIFLDGYEITGANPNLEKIRLKIGMVFQNFNLFPNKSVIENITLAPIKVKGEDEKSAKENTIAILKSMGLEDKVYAYPDSLSGGQKQRVAIARALANKPEVLLFDEPTSALDPEMVKEVLNVIKALAKKGLTMIIVTHEMGFAREISDKIVFMKNGIVEDIGDPNYIFYETKNENTKKFLQAVL